jgi:hypothetical protein
MDVTAPQLEGYRKPFIWPEPGMTCWNEDRKPVRYPLAVMQWHAGAFSKEREDFVSYAVCLDLWPQARRRFRLSCTRVRLGRAEGEWLWL